MAWEPRFGYGAGLIWEAAVPMGLWEYEDGPLDGGSDRSAAGVPEVWIESQTSIVRLRIIVLESERDAFDTMWKSRIANLSTPQPFRFDKADSATEYSTYIEAPLPPERLRWPRARDFNAAFELAISLRTSDGSRINVPAFP